MKTVACFLSLLFLSTMAARAASFYDFKVKDIDGSDVALKSYQGRVVLVVNVASACGYTPQYVGLEAIFKKYEDKGLTVLGFPCNQFGAQESGTNAEIKEFCSSKFGVTFPMFDKIEVNGDNRAPVYTFLSGPTSPFPGEITWNFNKFLIGRDGRIIQRFDSKSTPESPEVIAAIEAALAEK